MHVGAKTSSGAISVTVWMAGLEQTAISVRMGDPSGVRHAFRSQGKVSLNLADALQFVPVARRRAVTQ